MKLLSESRKEIYEPEYKSQLIIAPAGSGKTYTLIDTLLNRLSNGIIKPSSNKQKIIVFTFTNNAADELLVRLSEKIKGNERILNDIFIGTIHSYCNDFLDNEGRLSNTKIVDELERSQLIQRISGLLNIDELYGDLGYFQKVKKFENDIELYYNDNIDLRDYRLPSGLKTSMAQYIRFIEENRLLDFGSLIRKTISILNGKDVDKDCQYHIFVDEYQDLNPAQIDLLKKLLNKYPESYLFGVGDPRQAIYQWRGGDLNRLLDFKNEFESSEIYNLKINRRSRSGIIEFSNIISNDLNISNDISLPDTEPFRERRDNDVSVIGYNVEEGHADAVQEILISLLKEDIEYSDIAILFRSVEYQADEIMSLLDENDIPYSSPNKITGISFVQEFMFSIIDLIEIMNEMDERNFKTRGEKRRIMNEIENNLLNIKKYCHSASKDDIHLALSNWLDKLTDKKGKYFENNQYNFRQQLYDFFNEINFKVKPTEYKKMEGISSITQVMKSIEEIYRRRFRSYNKRKSPIDVFINNFKWHLKENLTKWVNIDDNIRHDNTITISTVHGAKGLEWPVVIVPYVVKNRFPVRSRNHNTSFPDDVADRYGTSFEDEKRLWYVAVTRAQERFYFVKNKDEESPLAYTEKTQNMGRIKEVEEYEDLKNLNLSSIEKEGNSENYYNLGVSTFLLLLECPYHFYIRYSLGLNPPVGEEFGAGNILHKTIERAIVDDVPLNEIVDEEIYLPLAEFKQEIKVKNSISRKISKFMESTNTELIDMTEYPFTLKMGNIVLSGIVDATLQKEGKVDIVDWKSNLNKEDLGFIPRYKNQLKVYFKALNDLDKKVDKGIIADISSSNPLDDGISLDFILEDIDSLLDNARKTLHDIREKGPYTMPNEDVCKMCDISVFCPDSIVE